MINSNVSLYLCIYQDNRVPNNGFLPSAFATFIKLVSFLGSMNNDAFQKLVRERATEKSSKEIAREAVEQEFRQDKRKRKRRRGAGGSSDEDGDGSDSDIDDDHKQKKEEEQKEQQQQEDRSKKGAGKKEKASSKYRDRAKERREGDNIDYQDSQRLLAGAAAAVERRRRRSGSYIQVSGWG
jgi:hypothetical protein